jgi:hypothetical protein
MVTTSLLEPIRHNPDGSTDGSNIIGPRNPDRERQDPDMILPPSTDSGTLPNMSEFPLERPGLAQSEGRMVLRRLAHPH